MTDDALTPEQLDFAINGLPLPTKFYVYYRTDGTIFSISNKNTDEGDYLEVDEYKVIDFLKGKKDYSRYRIEHFKQDKLPEKIDEIHLKNNILYQVPFAENVSNKEVVITHKTTDKCWNLSLTDTGKKEIIKMNLESLFPFYITKKDDPHYLISSIKVSGNDLYAGISVDFSSTKEQDYNNISVFVPKNFNSYGLVKDE